MITIGLDFGTHQTKVCIENIQGVELSYSFFKFTDTNGKLQYTLPSIINIDSNGLLSYGYIPYENKGEIVRYFKQAAFTTISNGQSQIDAMYYSIWYIAFILFDLEKMYNQDFVIQMGVPTDGERLLKQKQLAIRILSSAYRLVEDVFEGDKTSFLNTPIASLREITEFVDYSKDLQEEYQMLVFPEAYACLMPLISSSKIAKGMSLMVDIGGGTTDISFFTIKNNQPYIYDFKSINKGLNYLTDIDGTNNNRLDSNVQSETEIQSSQRGQFKNELNNYCNNLIRQLCREFKKQCNLQVERLMNALKSRPIIYTGGGSTFSTLRSKFGGFRDIIHISEKEWRTKSITDLNEIKALGLCPILSTAYGLSINALNDNIECESFGDIFNGLKGQIEEEEEHKNGDAIKPTSFRNIDYYFSRDDYYTLNYNGNRCSKSQKKKNGKKHR